MSATVTGTVLLVDAVATELADTAVLAVNAESPTELSHARARVLGDALGVVLSCVGRSPLIIPAIGSTVDWAYDTAEKQRWVNAFGKVLLAGWTSLGDEWTTPLEQSLGQAQAKQLVGNCYLDALAEFRTIDAATPSGTFSAQYWADRFAKKAVGKLTKSFVGQLVVTERMGRLGQEFATIASAAAKRVYAWVRNQAGPFIDAFKTGLKLWCGELDEVYVDSGILMVGKAAIPTGKPKMHLYQWSRAVDKMRAEALVTQLTNESDKERVRQIVRDMDARRTAADHGFVRLGFLQIGVPQGPSFAWESAWPSRVYSIEQAMADLDTYSHIKAYVKQYITWALACEQLGLVVSHDIPMDPSNLLKTWLKGPFTRTTPDGKEHVFYNRNHDPPGCVVV